MRNRARFASETYPLPKDFGGGGGGGSGGNVPQPPAAGLLLTSTGTGPNSFDWEPAGGPGITGFSKTNGSLFEVGASDVSPQFTASYNTPASSAQIAYTGASGSPLVLSSPFTTGVIAHTFTSSTNGASDSFTLNAVIDGQTKTAALTDTWALPYLSLIAATGATANQSFLDTMRAGNGAQLHTSNGGTYLNGQNVGAVNISYIATPTAAGTPTFKDKNGLVTSPVVVGTIAGYVNPFGVTVPMTLYSVGGVAIGIVSWSVS